MFSINDRRIICTKIQGKKRRFIYVGCLISAKYRQSVGSTCMYQEILQAEDFTTAIISIIDILTYVTINCTLHPPFACKQHCVCRRAKIIIGREVREPWPRSVSYLGLDYSTFFPVSLILFLRCNDLTINDLTLSRQIFQQTNHVCHFITLNYISMTHCVGIY